MNSNLSSLPFNRYQFNVYSQNGEDGVIAELHKRLGLEASNDSWCVEFGAQSYQLKPQRLVNTGLSG